MTIEQRVEKLEKQNRWMKRVGGLALAAVACVVLMGQGKPKELPDLDVRSLAVRDAAGESWATLGQLKGKSFLSLFDKAGKSRLTLASMADGSPALNLSDNAGETRVLLALLADGSPVLKMYDAKGNVVWQAPPK